MRVLGFALVATVVLAAGGCASMKVETVYDESADFSVYRSFDWIDQPATVVDNLSRMGQARQRIETAIESELASAGYSKSTSNPDFYVVYHASLERRITGATIDTWGYRYRRAGLRRGGVVVADVDVQSYEQGTLIIDIIDAEGNELVWRGTASDAVESREEASTKIEEAVAKTLAEFPPGR